MPETLSPSSRKPRKSPTQARSLATVEAIIEAAARILEATGTERFSTNAVAERAGVSIGSLYQYFPSKQALLWALIDRETSRLISDATRALDAPTGKAALDILVEATVAHQLRRPKLALLLDQEEARLPTDADLQRVAGQFLDLVVKTLQRLDTSGTSDHQEEARDVAAIIKGMIDAAGAFGETDPVRLARRVLRAVNGYLLH